ncbi:MAG: hypothetical protein WKF43_05485 [Acidimicrobiales bacterium]
MYQCSGTVPESLDDCNQALRPPSEYVDDGTGVPDGVTQPDGTGRVFFEVRPAAQLPALDCSARSPCSLIAFENDGEPFPEVGLPTTAVTAPLTFATSPADCPSVDTPDVTTAGEASTAHALYAWSARVCTGDDGLALDYTESSSPDGRENFLAGLIDAGITSMPPTTAEIQGSDRKFTYAPVDVSGVVVAFNASDVVTGQRITEMNLSPRLVAIIIAGHPGPGGELFADPEFQALNPGHTWPSTTYQPLLRSERNADTHLLTRWLDTDTAARRFLDGKDPNAAVDGFWKDIDYPTDIFESRNPSYISAYGPVSGTLAVARRLFIGQGAFQEQSPRLDVGVLGVMDLVTARKFGLSTARLRPANVADADRFYAPDGPALTAGFTAMTLNPDGKTRQADVTAPSGYPLVKVDYAMVPTSDLTEAKAADIATFIEYAAGGGQSDGVLPAGYVPLPGVLREQAASAGQAVLDSVADPPVDDPPPVDQPFDPSLGGTDFPPTDPGGPFEDGSFDDDGTFNSDQGTGGSSDGTVAGDSSSSGGGGSETAAPPSRAGKRAATVLGTDKARTVSKFAGGDAQMILPVLLVAGLVALALGPGLTLLGRRKGKTKSTAAGSSVPEPSTA